MVIFIYGTTGELIKLLPLVNAIPKNEQMHVLTNQQPYKVREFAKQIEGYEEIEKIQVGNGFRGNDIHSMPQMLYWYFGLVRGVFHSKFRKKIRALKAKEELIGLVHGDTNTTVVGCVLGRFAGIRVGHVEAGLRSGSLKHPFPEELNRRIAAKFCRVHFPPGKAALEALQKERVKGDIVFTEANTACDSIKWALSRAKDTAGKSLESEAVRSLQGKRYAIASIHRTELLYGAGAKERVGSFLDKLTELSKDMEIAFVDYPTTSVVIESLGLSSKMSSITRIPKQDYANMIRLLSGAQYILTDSGGFQEDSYYLGVPCVVHRMRTERDEGLGTSAELDYYDLTKVDTLLEQLMSNKPKRLLAKFKPTAIICTYLLDKNYISTFTAPEA